MSLCESCRTAFRRHNDKNIRQLLYWQIEDMGIDGTSPIGIYIIENYRPAFSTRTEMGVALHDDEGIRDWLAEHTGKIT